ncbi:hypothetical protein Tco_0623932 [Tanacetum coccineum]|uniref:Uncharacterized protein n=1 Tax=Tanacetum coccineum TaxID=301880 RepID=A0ABQ4WCH2_9ASTR
MAPPTELFPSDVDYVKFFMDSFTHPLFKKMAYLESNFIIGTLLTAYENFYPFTLIDIPVLEVGIPSQGSAIHSKFRNLGNSIPIKELTKGMSGTRSLLDAVQLADTLGTTAFFLEMLTK